jgi:hypothetical protein
MATSDENDVDIFVGDIVVFTVKTKVDLSTVTTIELHVYKPDRTLDKLVGTIDPTDDTKFQATTIGGLTPTLSVPGGYRCQAYITGGGADNHGEEFTITVKTPLEGL